MTGEISLTGLVKPIGGVIPKIKAAKQAGAKRSLSHMKISSPF